MNIKDSNSPTSNEARRIKNYFAQAWQDPVKRIEDTFNVRRADGSIVKLIVPEPQKKMIRDGILGKSRKLVGSGTSYVGVTVKGRQIGFSVISAAEAILIAEDFPGTQIWYVATATEQAGDWLKKVDQLIRDSNHWPDIVGGGSILTVKNIEKVFEKTINDTTITGLSANPSAIRGKTGIAVYFDEAAWAIRFKNQARETWKALKYAISQGGSARILSTPRTDDDDEFFWGFLKKGEEGKLAIHSYNCPVIENWKDIDINEPLYIELNNERRAFRGMRELTQNEIDITKAKYKTRRGFTVTEQNIRQNVKIPYWWVNIEDLETDRGEDLEQFKQENLCTPYSEIYKLIKSEWIYSNLNEGDELEDRGNSHNPFFMTIDIAQINDITAITITEKITAKDGYCYYIERRIEETQEEYPEQIKKIFNLYEKFLPEKVLIDNTGHGIVIGDYLVKTLREGGYDPNVLERVNFGQVSKEIMATGFRNIVMPDAITGKSRYKWLQREKKHENAIRHCLRVEKEVLPQGGVRYTGKMHGRDDHFWSKALIALVDRPMGGVKAAFGKMKKPTLVDIEHKITMGQSFIDKRNKERWSTELNPERIEEIEKENKIKMETLVHHRNLNFAVKCLENGIVICNTSKRPVKPIHCANVDMCNDAKCPGYQYVEEICRNYKVNKYELWNSQSIYPKG